MSALEIESLTARVSALEGARQAQQADRSVIAAPRFGGSAYNYDNNEESPRNVRPRISGITTDKRHWVSSVTNFNTVPGTFGRLESDSHADTSTAGANMTFISYTDHVTDVYGFSDWMQPSRMSPL